MTTASDIIERAYRKLGIVAIDEAMTADQLSHGLTTLNMMIHGWELWGIDTNHTDLGSADTFPLAAKFEEGTVYLLASRLSPDFEAPANFDADMFMRAIQAAYITTPELEMPLALLRTSSQRRFTVG